VTLKVAPPEDLVTAVPTVAAGHGLLDPAVTLRVIASYASAPAPDPARAAALAELTERETDVLALVAAGHSNAEIAARLYLGRRRSRRTSAAFCSSWASGPGAGGRVRLRERAGHAREVIEGGRYAGSHRRPSSDVSGVREAP
jgi:hypothetical protein